MKLKVLCVAALSALLFSACEKDFSEENGDLPGGIQLTTAAAPFANNSGCKDCEYIPMCSGSVYKYKNTDGSGTVTNVNYTMNYLKDTVMEGRNYKKFSMSAGNTSYLNCATGVSSAFNLSPASPVFLKQTLLKANDATGVSWTDNILDQGSPAVFHSEIAGKNMTLTVAGNVYHDVIHIFSYVIANGPGGILLRSAHADYYYAKGKGLIESKSYDAIGTMVEHRELISAVIPN